MEAVVGLGSGGKEERASSFAHSVHKRLVHRGPARRAASDSGSVNQVVLQRAGMEDIIASVELLGVKGAAAKIRVALKLAEKDSERERVLAEKDSERLLERKDSERLLAEKDSERSLALAIERSDREHEKKTIRAHHYSELSALSQRCLTFTLYVFHIVSPRNQSFLTIKKISSLPYQSHLNLNLNLQP